MTDTTAIQVVPIPEGFLQRDLGAGFTAINGPLYQKDVEGGIQLGLAVEMRHCNPMKFCHGGMVATFTDMLLILTAQTHPNGRGHFMATISLQIDYLAAAKLGSWMQGQAQVLKGTRNMIFTSGLIMADGEPVARVSAVFRIGPEFALAGLPKSVENTGATTAAKA